MRFRKTAAVLAAALGGALFASPAHAEFSAYQPSEADFATCPAKPAGAKDWTCYVSTAISGGFTIGSNRGVRIIMDKPLQFTAASGTLNDGTAVAAWGALKQPQNFKVVTVVPGTTIILSVLPEIEAKVIGLGLTDPGSIDGFKVKLQLWNSGGLLGQNCTIGTDADPVQLRPQETLTLPWLFWFTPMAKRWSSENTYALPKSTNCGRIPLYMPNGLDSFIGLPAASGTNTADFTWAIRHKTY
ncbi:hypothetical protein GCM10027589_05310 [Actinocorallia lasiicapitis]